MTKKNTFQKNKDEIIWNLINCGLSGVLVFAGAISDGTIGHKGWLAVSAVTLIAVVVKFQKYWTSQENEYTKKVLNFI